VLLEGPAIEPLLAQVREEYGSGVRIISADKVRSGGFGGFFAKQHYELSVEVPDTNDDRKNTMQRTTKAAPPPREEPANTLEQLLERAESHDRIAADDTSPYERPKPALRPAPADKADKLHGRDAGMEDTDAAVGRSELSGNAAAFAELMAGMDATSHIATSRPVRPSPRPKAAEEDDDKPTVRPFRPAAATGSPVNAGSNLKPLPPVPSLAELMGGLGVADGEKTRTVQGRSAATTYGLNSSPGSPEDPAPGLRPVHADPVIRNLISVGMPERMAAQITGGDTYAGVLTALAARPAAPAIPDAPGEILVLAGDLDHAVPIGKDLLQQAGIDQSHLLLAGPSGAGTGLHSSRVMPDVKAAAARAEKLQTSDSAWIVVLDAPVGRTDPIWVNDMCDAIGATAVWAVVDATRKTADTARHLRTLGEVEALVVHNVESTADPATVLGLDVPIFSMDGKPATPHAWAAMLCARIAADVTPQAAPPRRQVRSAR
jgi:hypothetical protein